jgi:23S rRNA (adenine2030-N6)-methyltransferase
MLSYQHGFHAGNHADVLKHSLLCLLLVALRGKDKAFAVVDTHAGAGMYDLRGGQAGKNREYRSGIGCLWERQNWPAELTPYRDAIAAANVGQPPPGSHYPGSPWIIRSLLRPQDRLVACELHSREAAALALRFAGDRRVQVHPQDGLRALKEFLPPPERRGLVFIDPAYEQNDTAERTLEALRAALDRWPTGIFTLWYPLLDRGSAPTWRRRLTGMGSVERLTLELCVELEDGPPGLKGSGLVVYNPPWQLDTRLRTLLPWLWAALDPERQGRWNLSAGGVPVAGS